MANTHNSKAKLKEKNKKNEGKKVMPEGLAGDWTQDLSIMRPMLYWLSYRCRVKFPVEILGILSHYVRENEANLKHFTK